MEKTITIPLEKYKCLREHLNQANEIFKSLGMAGSEKPPKAAPRKTKAQMVAEFQKITRSGVRVKKPDHLKK